MSSSHLQTLDTPGALFGLRDQVESSVTGPIVFINTFVLPSIDTVDAFIAHWTKDGQWMTSQPGCIKGQLHRAIGAETTESNVFINVAQWDSVAAWKAATGNPEFLKMMEGYPEGIKMFPQVTKKVAIPGVCTD